MLAPSLPRRKPIWQPSLPRPTCRAGHKYAGNVVAYGAMHPCDGDVFGGLTAASAGAFLDALMEVEVGGAGRCARTCTGKRRERVEGGGDMG